MGEIIKKDDLEKNIQSVWGTKDPEQLKNIANEVRKSVKRSGLKHGLFAHIPLICRGNVCPYKSACPIENKPVGERCPVEIGAILSRFESLCNHFGIRFNEKGEVHVEDVVDSSMIRDLVDLEIQILRADNKLAIDGDFIGKTVKSVSEQGQVYYDDIVTPAAEFKMVLLKQKNKVLEKLNATRKDKTDSYKDDHTAKQSKHLLDKIEELANKNNIEAIDFEDVDLDNVVVEEGEIEFAQEKEIEIIEEVEEKQEITEEPIGEPEESENGFEDDFEDDFDDEFELFDEI